MENDFFPAFSVLPVSVPNGTVGSRGLPASLGGPVQGFAGGNAPAPGVSMREQARALTWEVSWVARFVLRPFLGPGAPSCLRGLSEQATLQHQNPSGPLGD